MTVLGSVVIATVPPDDFNGESTIVGHVVKANPDGSFNVRAMSQESDRTWFVTGLMTKADAEKAEPKVQMYLEFA